MSEHQWKAFTVAIADGIAEVTLIGPGKGNVMGPDFWNELPAVFAELDRDDARDVGKYLADDEVWGAFASKACHFYVVPSHD